jgi:hypothetical protein
MHKGDRCTGCISSREVDVEIKLERYHGQEPPEKEREDFYPTNNAPRTDRKWVLPMRLGGRDVDEDTRSVDTRKSDLANLTYAVPILTKMYLLWATRLVKAAVFPFGASTADMLCSTAKMRSVHNQQTIIIPIRSPYQTEAPPSTSSSSTSPNTPKLQSCTPAHPQA